MKPNLVKAALQAGNVVVGSELSGLRTPEVARIYAAAGFDFVFIDMEHTSFSLETVAEMVRAAREAEIVSIVRVPQAEYVWVARVLDNGAQGVIVPRVNTPRQVEDIVSWVRYPPNGIRGYACTTAQTGGQSTTAQEFIDHVHQNTLLVIQIERREAVENIEAMLSVPGVDVACLGYMDLSVDLGIPGQIEHPRMVAAIERLIDQAARRKIAAGIISPEMTTVAHWVERGMRFVSYATDAILLQEASRGAVVRLRGLNQHGAPPCQR